jgi:diguanylate cyclase
MFRTNTTLLQRNLEQLTRASLEHAEWRDNLLRVISGRQPCNHKDLAPDAYRRCLFGQWYFEQALPELRELPSFALVGTEHEAQHRIAAQVLKSVLLHARIERAAIEEFEDVSARLSYALYFIRREIECALDGRDALTDAHSSAAMMRDMLEWHAVARQPGRQCCIAIMELDSAAEISASQGEDALVSAVNNIAEHLRITDRVFRYDGGKFLIRLSGTDLASGRKLIMRLRETITHGAVSVGADGVAVPVTASFGLALLDPDVGVHEAIDRANHALALARTSGRNRVIVWDPSVTTGVRLRRLEPRDVER